MTTTETNPIDQARLEAFVGQAVTDMGAAISGLLLHIGDRLGLYKAMAGPRAATAAPPAAPPRPARPDVRQGLRHPRPPAGCDLPRAPPGGPAPATAGP